MIILVDTREQLPFWHAPHAAKCKLHAGDYTTVKLLHRFHIERKSPQDLYGTLTKGHRRFKNELWRAKDTGTTLVILIECTHEQFVNKRFSGGHRLQFPGEGLRKMIQTISHRYQLEFIWCENRAHAIDVARRRLYLEERKYTARASNKIIKNKNKQP